MKTERIRGRALQALRLRIYIERQAKCGMCGRIVAFPNGFDLDHVKALDNGGDNSDENYQLLCNAPGECHDKKTAQDLGYTPKKKIGLDGWPIEDQDSAPRWKRVENAGRMKA